MITIFTSIINMLKNGITSSDLIVLACLIYLLSKIEMATTIIIEEIISIFSKKHKEIFLLNLEWYSPNYLLFRSDLTNYVSKVRGLKNGD